MAELRARRRRAQRPQAERAAARRGQPPLGRDGPERVLLAPVTGRLGFLATDPALLPAEGTRHVDRGRESALELAGAVRAQGRGGVAAEPGAPRQSAQPPLPRRGRRRRVGGPSAWHLRRAPRRRADGRLRQALAALTGWTCG